jgi:ferredoxin
LAKFTINIQSKNGTADVPFLDDTTILESLEYAKVETHSHCRDGFCGACRCKLQTGTVNYTTDPLAFIDDDEILPCCSVPTSNITIELE